MNNMTFEFGKQAKLTLSNFHDIIYRNRPVGVTDEANARLDETRLFIDHLLKNNIKVYGVTTGFADLRDCAVSTEQAAELSHLMLQSHDAGIGESMPLDVILGAMVIRAHSLAQGYSGFQKESLNVLVEMINKRIIPHIPCTGS